MTIGPAPMIRMVSISPRLGILVHQRDKPLEKVVAVLWARARFRVMLDRKDGLPDDAQTFICIVKQRQMRRLDPSRQALGIDDKTVILAGDLDLAGQQVLDRVV